MTDLPKSARYWPLWVQDRFNERVAMMREANRLDDAKPLPFPLLSAAIEEASAWMEMTAERNDL